MRHRRHVRAKVRICDALDPRGKMNKLERSMALELEAKKRAGDIHEWRYERVTLKLADDTRYTPDFEVIENDGALTMVETKGRWMDDAKVKIKVAAEQFPERTFKAFRPRAKKHGGGWDIEEF
jgi:hypothetical protein